MGRVRGGYALVLDFKKKGGRILKALKGLATNM